MYEFVKVPEHFEISKDDGCYRLSDHGSPGQVAIKVIATIDHAQKQAIGRLLIDTTKWTDHDSPNTMER